TDACRRAIPDHCRIARMAFRTRPWPAQKAQAPAAGKRLLGSGPIVVAPVPVTRLAMIRRSRGSLLARTTTTKSTGDHAMLNKFDDYPIHQTAEPLAHPATSHTNFYDRTWFNG